MTLVRDYDPKFLLMLMVNLCVYFLFLLLNDAFAGLSVYLFMPALLLVAPSLFLGRAGAIFMGLIFGFFYEANAPVRFIGANALIFAAFCFAINSIRDKFRSLDPFAIMWLTWSVNILIFAACTLFVYPRGMEHWQAYLARLSVDILISSMFVMLFSSYAINLQKSFCYLFGVDLSIENKEDSE